MAEVTKTYLADMAARMRSRLAAVREAQEVTMDRAVAIIEVWGTSFALGWYHGRAGVMRTLWGVPYDAIAALIGYAVAFSGMAGKMGTEHVFNIAQGAGAYYAGNLGAQLGQRMRKDAGELKGAPMSEEDAKKIPAQVRTIVAGGESQQGLMGGAPPWMMQEAMSRGGNAMPAY